MEIFIFSGNYNRDDFVLFGDELSSIEKIAASPNTRLIKILRTSWHLWYFNAKKYRVNTFGPDKVLNISNRSKTKQKQTQQGMCPMERDQKHM